MDTRTEILVVDDNIDLATILQDTLKGEGYDVMIAHDGKTALAICQENRFDLALIDIKLPDMPGIELINKLAELSPKTEYIIITAHATMETAIEAVKQKNIVAYQTKPLDINQLLYFTKQVIERRQAKEALRESENKLSQAIEGSSIPTFIIDKNHTVTHWNKACENLTAISASEIIGTKNQWSVFYSEKRPVMADIIMDEESEKDIAKYYGGKYQKSVLTEGTYEAEDFFPNLGEDGKWLFFTAAPLKDHQGKVIGAIETLQDITERKQHEEILKQEKERFQILVEESPVGMSLIGKDGTYKYLNPRFIELFGYTLKDIPTGREWFKKAYPDEKYRKEIISTWMEDLKEHGIGRSRPREYTVTCKDGSKKIINFMAVTLPNQDQMVSYEDLSEIKLEERKIKGLETQLRQAQKMEAIGTLAGGIAHDFNNILAAIIGYAELAKIKVPEDSEILPNLDQVLKSGNRAKTLVQQILAFSRKQELEQKPLQLKYIVKESLKFLKSTLPTDIEIKQDIAKDIGIVNADPSQMQQVIMNLCTNAGHAMQKEGGVLAVGLANVELDDIAAAQYLDIDAGTYLRLTVSDTGYGMTSDVKDRIFEPYFTTKEKGVGTGMGLSVVNGIVNSHGGTITIESEPGKGSTFHVYIPLIQEGVIKPEIDIDAPISIGNERILFIDDELALVDIGKEMLKHFGYEVTSRTSSIEALELFRTKPDRFDLVITDMTMPNMTGDKLAKELIKIRPDIPIIICTGFSERISEEKAKGMGIKAFAMKPLVMQDLAKTVRKVLDEN